MHADAEGPETIKGLALDDLTQGAGSKGIPLCGMHVNKGVGQDQLNNSSKDHLDHHHLTT